MVTKIPNILSGLRILLAPVFVLMYVQEEEFWSALSIAVFAIAAVTDFFDGYIARNYGAETAAGSFLDPLADKFLTVSGFLCLTFIRPDQFPLWAVSLIVARDVGVTLLRIYADRNGAAVDTSRLAKWKTAIQMGFLYTSLIVGAFATSTIAWGEPARGWLNSGFFYWALMAVTALTVWTGLEYVLARRRVVQTPKTDGLSAS